MNFMVTKIDSSVIKGIKYEKSGNLTVQLGDRLYTYKNVPKTVAMDFVAAKSKGKFYNTNIKDEFEIAE